VDDVLIVCVELELDEPGLAQWQWDTSQESSWLPGSPPWHSMNTDDGDTTFEWVLNDTLATGLSTADLEDSTVVVRVRAKDVHQNVSDWWGGIGNLSKLFERGDTSPPDTVDFAAVTFDTSVAVYFCMEATADEVALAQWQFKINIGGSWAPGSPDWHGANASDSVFVTDLRDTITSIYAPVELTGDTIYVQFTLKDTLQNTSSMYEPDGVPFVRYEPDVAAIASVTAGTYYEGLAVNIVGTGFGKTQGSGYISLDDSSAYELGNISTQTAGSWTDTLVTYTVSDTTTWANGDSVWAELTNDDGNYDNYGGRWFLRCYTSGMTPAHPARIAAGDTITITGGNFGASQGGGYVLGGTSYNYTPADSQEQAIAEWGDTEIKFALDDDSAWVDGDSIHIKVWNDELDSNRVAPLRWFDEDPPDTTSYVTMTLDTTDTDDVAVILSTDATEAALWQTQYKINVGGSWDPVSPEWRSVNTDGSDTTFGTTLLDSIWTKQSTADLTGDTLFSRIVMKDSFFVAHLSSAISPDTIPFVRATPAGGDTVLYVFSDAGYGYTIEAAAAGDQDTLIIGTDTTYAAGGQIYELQDSGGAPEIDIYDAVILCESPTYIHTADWVAFPAEEELPLSRDEVDAAFYLMFFDVKSVIADSSITEVLLADVYVMNIDFNRNFNGGGAYVEVICANSTDYDNWTTGTAHGTQDWSRTNYDYADTTGSVAWGSALSNITSCSVLGIDSVSISNPQFATDTWKKFGDLSAGVEGWRTGDNEAGFWLYGQNGGSWGEINLARIRWGEGGATLVLRVIR